MTDSVSVEQCDRELVDRATAAWIRSLGLDATCDEYIAAMARTEALRQSSEREEMLREALEAAWQHGTKMRNASKLVGPYPNDAKANRIWARGLYHEGKKLHETLKPLRQALEATNG